MPILGAETSAVQLPMIRYAQDIGWKLVSQAEALRRRGGETGLVCTQTLTDKIIELNRDNSLARLRLRPMEHVIMSPDIAVRELCSVEMPT